MVNIDSLWGDDFSIKNTKEADLELLEKTKKPLKSFMPRLKNTLMKQKKKQKNL